MLRFHGSYSRFSFYGQLLSNSNVVSLSRPTVSFQFYPLLGLLLALDKQMMMMTTTMMMITFSSNFNSN